MSDRFNGREDNPVRSEAEEIEPDLYVPEGYVIGESDDWGFMILKRNDDYPVFTYSVLRRNDDYPVFTYSVLRHGFITREAAINWILAERKRSKGD